MSDFLYSSISKAQGELTNCIKSIYHNDPPDVFEYHGNWGSLGVSRNLYNGFQPLETPDHICVIIGGPVLYFRDNLFLTGHDPVAGTKAIYKRWQTDKIQWDEDLSGPFAILIVNKKNHKIVCVTDLMSFIPVFESDYQGVKTLGTHVEALAKATGCTHQKDKVSLADFVFHGFVTFPYTVYSPMRQLAPACIHQWNATQNLEYKSRHYWQPLEEAPYRDIDQAAIDLKECLQSYVDAVTKSTDQIGLLLNREGRIAQKAASAYGATLNIHTRSETHYLNILPQCSDLVGGGSQYNHGHTYGFHHTAGLKQYSCIFGGFLTDALTKGCNINKAKKKPWLPFFSKAKQSDSSHLLPLTTNLLESTILSELNQRRSNHYQWVKAVRPESVDEWFKLWPSSMHKDIPNLHVNRRLFRTYEPFMSNDVVKLSARIPQKWKLRRRLYQRMAKPLLEPAKHIPHPRGWIPYYPWYVNKFLRGTTKRWRNLITKIGTSESTQVHQGPWTNWQKLMQSQTWKSWEDKYASEHQEISPIFTESIRKLFEGNNLKEHQKRNLLQTLYLVEKNSQ